MTNLMSADTKPDVRDVLATQITNRTNRLRERLRKDYGRLITAIVDAEVESHDPKTDIEQLFDINDRLAELDSALTSVLGYAQQ